MPETDSSTHVDMSSVSVEVEQFCGDCHAAPRPESFPKNAWYTEVKRGYDFYNQSGRSDLSPPPMGTVVKYYRALAPDKLEIPVAGSRDASGALAFQHESVDLQRDESWPAVSQLRYLSAEGAGQTGHLVACDMQSGVIARIAISGRELSAPQSIGKTANPGQVEIIDIDADGVSDWLIADLGSFQPADHQEGRVVRLNDLKHQVEPSVLLDHVGRVADVQGGDFDNDGDIDLVVAEFGWQETGSILLMRQTKQVSSIPKFEVSTIDNRHGTIHVPAVDINNDGHLDFVALISQEHEVIEAFINDGKGSFEKQRILTADDPAFGSSGIELVDMDLDGDVDVLYTNGDMLDSFYLKPYHAIHWLENTGSFPFVRHEIATMPGVMRALATDLDGDSDMDIVACAYVPEASLRSDVVDYDSLLWIEQRSKTEFVRHTLERSRRGHMAMEVHDFDHDGRPDIAVGNFVNHAQESREWIRVWWNQRRQQAKN